MVPISFSMNPPGPFLREGDALVNAARAGLTVSSCAGDAGSFSCAVLSRCWWLGDPSEVSADRSLAKVGGGSRVASSAPRLPLNYGDQAVLDEVEP